MSDEPKKRMTNVTFDQRLTYYDDEAGMDLLRTLARKRGMKAAQLLRVLVREEAKREAEQE